MYYFALFVLDDSDFLDPVLEKLSKEGFKGATILESTGLFRHQKKSIPMRFLYAGTDVHEKENVTIFLILENRESVQKALKLVESVVGDLNKPSTGVFASWPIEMVKGLKNISDDGEIAS